ncbi:MAG: hypothetical protein LC803_09310 [Acidobacteria bacterium]|nr:hypothetical protein [Acidobacteriota bacterium]
MTLISPSQSNPGETIEANDINDPINQIVAVVNGNLDSTNISSLSGADIQAGTLPATAATTDANVETRMSESFGNFIVPGGCVLTATGGLNWSLSAGVIYVSGRRVAISATTGSVVASKDTYVAVDSTGTISYTGGLSVANNANSPALPAGSMWIGILVSNGSGITSINQGSVDATAPVVTGSPLTVSDSNGQLIFPYPGQDLLGLRINTVGFGTGATSDTLITGLTLPFIGRGGNVNIEAILPNTLLSTTANAYLTIYDGATKKQEAPFTFAGASYVASLRATYTMHVSAGTTKTLTGNVRVSGGSLTIAAFQNILRVTRA